MVVKPAMRLMEVRAISDSGETSSRVGTSRMFDPKSECSSAPIRGRASEPGMRRPGNIRHIRVAESHDTVELFLGLY